MNQFTPNSYCHINAFGVEPVVSTFLQFYKVMPKARGCFYYLGPQGSNAVKYHFTWKRLGSRKGWHQEFFFMEPLRLWGLQTSRKVCRLPDVKHPLKLLKDPTIRANHNIL